MKSGDRVTFSSTKAKPSWYVRSLLPHTLSHTLIHTRILTPCSLLLLACLLALSQFDCGIHPGNQGQLALPYLDTVDLKTVDILFISHFHLDHAAGVPYLYTKTDFKGQMFATRPTKAIMHLLLGDYMRVLQPTIISSCVTYWSSLSLAHSRSLSLSLRSPTCPLMSNCTMKPTSRRPSMPSKPWASTKPLSWMASSSSTSMLVTCWELP